MAGGVTREGDLFGAGGIVFGNSASNVTVDGRPVALTGSFYTPHILKTPAFMQTFGQNILS